jgi:DNA polymerase III epsilon subunit-like protein
VTDQPWYRGELAGFDVETTGLSVWDDRIVTASMPVVRPGSDPPVLEANWLIDPGVEIPLGATKIHGVTTAHARARGEPPRQALEGIVECLCASLGAGRPLVCMNATYDLTLLDSDCRRHGVPTLAERVGVVAPVIDILVIDRRIRPEARGNGARKLGALCKAYNADGGQAHSSAHDALAAIRVAWRMAHTQQVLRDMTLSQLHQAQARWKQIQDTSMANWLRSKGRPTADCDGQWPMRRR